MHRPYSQRNGGRTLCNVCDANLIDGGGTGECGAQQRATSGDGGSSEDDL
jgi:hypothetical protein